jgi:hypothetical protein
MSIQTDTKEGRGTYWDSGLMRTCAGCPGNLLLLRGETADAEDRFRQANEIAFTDRDEFTLASSRSGLGCGFPPFGPRRGRKELERCVGTRRESPR